MLWETLDVLVAIVLLMREQGVGLMDTSFLSLALRAREKPDWIIDGSVYRSLTVNRTMENNRNNP